MPILHKRIDKNTFGVVLEKVSSRLAGWKSRTLSFAGRITLTKAVLSSIPVHLMSSIILPASILSSLDKLSRDFVWGGTGEQRRQHLIAWARICRPKREGGLGIRSSSEMNKALIAKVGWRVLQDQDSLWARVVRSKYKVGEVHDPSWVITKGTWSPIWRSVVIGLRDVVLRGLSWIIGDGRLINFWTDRWFWNSPLCDMIQGQLPMAFEQIKARDLWQEGGGWSISQIQPFVSAERWMELAAVVIDSVTGARDRLSWGETANGQFTVRSAYALLSRREIPMQEMEMFYKQIWRVIAPERVKTFLWLVRHQVIMTNQERLRRHLSSTDVCQVCGGGVESILHVLRDCPAMEGIWLRLVPHGRRNIFFSASLLEWLYENLLEKTPIENVPWATIFAIALWWAWKWWCLNVFGGNKLCRDRTRFIKEKALEAMKADEVSRWSEHRREKVERLIKWEPPRVGWFKLNTDGASHGNPGLATAGGVLRNGDGKWCRGFALNIGRCSAPLAELWGVYYGLCIAWEARVLQVELEIDSIMVVDFLKSENGDFHPLSFLVYLCHGFFTRDWTVRVTHRYREANRLADGLANYAFSLQLGIHVFEEVPPALESILVDDVLGQPQARLVGV